MKVIVLAAGASSRFCPLADGRVKDMVPIMGKPILERTILALKDLGIKDIVLVVSGDGQVKEYFGDGKKFSVNISYVVQEKPIGMADALLRAKNLIDDDFLMLNAHHFDLESVYKQIVEEKKRNDAVLLVQKRENYSDYGVINYEDRKVVGIEEKPKKTEERTKLCLVGIYYLNKEFVNFLESFSTDQYQLEKALDKYAKGKNVSFVEVGEKLLTLKYPWDLFGIRDYLFKSLKGNVNQKVELGKGVILEGEVLIEDGAIVMENAVIKGPAYIGKNVIVGNGALIRNGTVLEEGSKIGAFSEIKNSIFLPGATLGSGFMASSIIGEKCKLAHGFMTANHRFDRKNIIVNVCGKEVDSGFNDLGVFMGENVASGIGVGTMPGITIGKGSVIGPGTFVFENIDPGVEYKTQFENLVKKI